jgi:hypothetical protein
MERSMHGQTVETCPDDLAVLRGRLDELAHGGARIVSVVWPQRADSTRRPPATRAEAS